MIIHPTVLAFGLMHKRARTSTFLSCTAKLKMGWAEHILPASVGVCTAIMTCWWRVMLIGVTSRKNCRARYKQSAQQIQLLVRVECPGVRWSIGLGTAICCHWVVHHTRRFCLVVA